MNNCTKLLSFRRDISQKIVFVFGLIASGKSFLCNYVAHKYGFNVIHLRRMFEKKMGGVNSAANIYMSLLSKYNNRTKWLESMSEEIEYVIERENAIIVEGLFTHDEYDWFVKKFKLNNCFQIYIENNDIELRFNRYFERGNYSMIEARDRFNNSNENRVSIGVENNKLYADYIIVNEGSDMEYRNKIDKILIEIMCEVNK